MLRDATLSTPARTRAIAVFIALSAGVWLGVIFGAIPLAAWFAAATVAAGLMLMRRGVWSIACVLIAIAMLGVGYASHRLAPPPTGSFGESLDQKTPQIVELEGLIAQPIRTREVPPDSLERFLVFGDAGRASFPLRVSSAGGRDASGVVWITGPPQLADLFSAGDTVRLTASMVGTGPGLNPTPLAFDRERRNHQSGVVGRGSFRDPTMIEAIEPVSLIERVRAGWVRARALLQSRAQQVLGVTDQETLTDAQSLLAALVLGQRSQDAENVGEVFRNAGVLHLLSISGFHVAVMAGAALIVVRVTGERGWLEPVLVAALLLAYLTIVPVRAPIVRAGSMALGLLLARAIGRRHDPIAVLAWVAVGVVLWRPLELFSLGFQLSFGLVGVLILWGERRRRDASLMIETDASWWRWLWSATREFWGVCVVCWLVAAPVILLHAGPLTPYGILASMIATPIAVVLLWSAFGALLLGMLVPAFSVWLTPVLNTIAGWMWGVVSWVESLPGSSWSAPEVPTLWAVAAVAGSVAIVLRGRLRTVWPYATMGALLVWLGASWLRPPSDVALRVDMLSVGDGTCLVVRAGDDVVLWDAGSLRPDPRSIERVLLELGVREIDAAIVTHANLDHYLLLPELIDRFGIEQVWSGVGVVESTDRAVTRFRELVAERGVGLELAGQGMELVIGSATLRLIGPSAGDTFREENDRSLIALVEAPTSQGVARVLLTGDVQRAGLARLLERGVPRVDVMELPHHGSYVPLSAALIEAADPAVVLQSTGPRRVGNPAWAPSQAGRVWLTTAVDGWSWVEIDRDGVVRAGSMRDGSIKEGVTR